MHQDTAWCRGRRRPKRHCVTWGLLCPQFKGHFALAQSPMSATADLLSFGNRPLNVNHWRWKEPYGLTYCIHILKLHILCLCCWLIDFHELICFKYVICLQFVDILQLITTLHILCLFCKFFWTRGFCSHTLYSALNRSLDCWAFQEKFTTIHRQMVGFSRVSRVRVSVRIRVRFSFSGANLNRKTLGGELLPDVLKRQYNRPTTAYFLF